MAELGYNVTVCLLLAADFGAPQLRRRLFFLGCRNDIGTLQAPHPTHSADSSMFDLKPYATVGEAFSGLPPIEFSDLKKRVPVYENNSSGI